MSLTVKESTLQEALKAAKEASLPRSLAVGNNGWIKAIALVTKVGGFQTYCLVDNDGTGRPVVKRDFGPSRAIYKIEAIYPYETLDVKRFSPDLRSDKQIVEFLSKNEYNEAEITYLLSKDNKDPEMIKAHRAQVKSYVYKVALHLAKKTLQEEQRCAEIKEYAKRLKNGEEE